MSGWGNDDELVEDSGAWGSGDELIEERPAARRGGTRAELQASDARGGHGFNAVDPRRLDLRRDPGPSIMDTPAAAAAGRQNQDPLLDQSFVTQLREDFAALPDGERLPVLREMAAGTDAYARAARQILRDVERENANVRDTMAQRGDLVDLVRKGGGALPAAGQGGARKPAAATPMPEINRLMQLESGQSDAQVLGRDAAARGIEAADRSVAGTRDRAELAARDFEAEAFAKDSPMLGALGSGAARMWRGTINAVPLAMDFAARLAGVDTTGINQEGEYSANLKRLADGWMPEVGKQDMDKAWDKGEFGGWLITNLVAQAPQIAQSVVAAFVPGAQGAALTAMGTQAAGGKFADTGRSDAAVLSGLVEAGSESLPLKAFHRSAEALRTLPQAMRGEVVQAIGRALPKVGEAVSMQAVVGAIEETVAQVGNNAIDAAVLRENKGLLDDVASSAVLGAFASKAMSLPQVGGALARVAQSPERQLAAAIDADSTEATGSLGAFAQRLDAARAPSPAVPGGVPGGVPGDTAPQVAAPPPAPRVQEQQTTPLTPEQIQAMAPARAPEAEAQPVAAQLGGAAIPQGSLADMADQALRERARVNQPDLAEPAAAPAGAGDGGRAVAAGSGAAVGRAADDAGVGGAGAARATAGAAQARTVETLDPADPALAVEQSVEPFRSQGEALAFVVQNRLAQRVEVVKTPGNGYVLQPKPPATSGQTIREDASEVTRLNHGLEAAGWRHPDGRSVQLDVVPDDEAPEGFSVFQRIAHAAFGIRVVPVVGATGDGIQFGSRAFVDVERAARSPAVLIGTTGHEAFHWLERNDPTAWQSMRTALLPLLQGDAVARQQSFENARLVEGEDPVDEAYATEEVLANINGAMWVDPDFWGRLYELDNGSTFRKVLYQFARAATKLVKVARGFVADGAPYDVSQYVTDVAAVREVAARVWAERAQERSKPKADAASERIVSERSAAARSAEKSYTHEVVDSRTGAVVGKYQGASNARRARDRKDNQFGAYRYRVREIGKPEVRLARASDARQAKIREAAEMAADAVPQYAIDDAVDALQDYEGAPPVFMPDADRTRLEAAIAPLLERAKAQNEAFKAKVVTVAARLRAKPKTAGVKGVKRAAEKMFQEEVDTGKAFDETWLKDLVRGSIVVETEAEVPGAIEAIRESFDVVRVKDRFANPLSTGYRDVLINVRLPDGMWAELQVHIPEMLAAKELGHLLYEVERALPNGRERDGLVQAQLRFYGAAYDAASGSEPRLATSASNSASETSMPSFMTNPPDMALPVSADTGLNPGSSTTGMSLASTSLDPAGRDFQSNATTDSSVGPTDRPILPRQARGRRGRDVGGYTVIDEADGGITVAGDQAEIRTLVPEGVKGRLVEGGVYFTPTQSPRVIAALEGEEVAYGRAGEVRPNPRYKGGDRAGQYIGAPETFNTPAKIPHLRRLFMQLAREGEPGKMWYERSGEAVLAMVGHDREEARKFISLLAIYSPQAKVDANSTFALRAWAQYKAGEPIQVKTGKQDGDATAVVYEGKQWGGEKTNNFFRNLMREVDAELGSADKQGVTVDMWMMRAAGYDTDAPTQAAYRFVENETNRLAQELGWEPQQVQAAIWVAMKARTENAQVKADTVAESIKKGFSRHEENHKGNRVLKVLNEVEHRKLWLKHAFALQVAERDTNGAKFDFADGVRRHLGQISWEARPGRSTGVLPGVNDAPYQQQAEFQMAVAQALTGPQGEDLLAKQLGLLADGKVLAPGVWQSEVAAGMQSFVSMAPAKGDDGKTHVDPAQHRLLNAYSATLGLLLRQEGVGWHRPFYAANKRDHNGVELRAGRPLTPFEAEALWRAIDDQMRAGGVPDWEQGVGMISSQLGMRLVNFGAVEDNSEFQALVLRAAATLPDSLTLDPVAFASDGNLATNDWKEQPNGEGFRDQVRAAGRPDVLGWAERVLAPAVQAVFDDFSQRYGWGPAGQPGRAWRQSRAAGPAEPAGRPGAGRAAGDGRDAAQGRQGAVAGWHYGRIPGLTSLSGQAYGSGIRGAEAKRLAEPGTDPRIKRRVYFYIARDNGSLPLREAGLGPFRYEAQLEGLADTHNAEHMARVREVRTAWDDNGLESAILDAGFSGYISRAIGMAVVLNRDVPVEYAGRADRAEGAAAPAVTSTTVKRSLLSKEAAALEPRLAELQAVAPSAKLRMGTLSFDVSDQAPVDAFLAGEYAGVADPFADGYKALDGRKVTFQVRIEDTGQTATLSIDAAQHLRDLDDRAATMRRLLDCISR